MEKEKVEIVVPLKYLSSFCTTLDIPLINCEVSLALTLQLFLVFTGKTTRNPDPDADPAVAAVNIPTEAIFKVRDKKLYVTVVTLSTQDDNYY